MANRNRVIYQSEALYAGPTPVTGTHTQSNIKQIQRVQSANYSFTIERQDVNQYGELASIDRVILSAPTVALDFSYLLANLSNEKHLGFHISNNAWVSCISGILNKSSDEKNYFIRTVAEGGDALGIDHAAADQVVIGVGNGFVTSYTTEGSVGNFPTVSVNVEALNMKVDNAVSGASLYAPHVATVDGTANSSVVYTLPDAIRHSAVSDETSVLRPGQINFSLMALDSSGAEDTAYSEAGTKISDAKIQSYNISFDLGRTPLEKLGSKFAFAREIDFPVTITMSIEANVGDLTTGNLASIISTDKNYNLYVKLYHPTNTTTVQAQYLIKMAKLDSQEFSSAIGDNKSVTLNFSAQVGGPAQNDIGFFMSGVV